MSKGVHPRRPRVLLVIFILNALLVLITFPKTTGALGEVLVPLLIETVVLAIGIVAVVRRKWLGRIYLMVALLHGATLLLGDARRWHETGDGVFSSPMYGVAALFALSFIGLMVCSLVAVPMAVIPAIRERALFPGKRERAQLTARIRAELEEQQALLSLSLQQQSAIAAYLARPKYVDYVVGFFLGIFSSWAFDFLKTVLPRIFVPHK